MSKDFNDILNLSSIKNISISVLMELTYRCDFKCSHCFYKNSDKNKEELKIDEILNLLVELKESGTLFLTFSGGEVFLRKDLEEILKHAIKMGFSLTLFTNGSKIKESILKKEFKNINFEISLYPDEISGFKSEDILENIERLKKNGFNISVKILLLRGFIDFYLKTVEKLKKIDIENIFIDFTIYPENSQDKYFKKLTPEIEELKKFFSKFQEFLKPFKERIKKSGEDAICSAGRRFCSIDPYGNVHPCPFLKLNCGNIREKSFKDLWENSEKFKELRKLKIKDWKECLTCNSFEICRMCPAISFIDFKNVYKHSEINCFYTKILSQL